MNVYDSDRIRDILLAAGLTPADEGAGCDVFILNTCSVREKPRQKVISAISQARAANARVLVVVAGCVAQLEPETLTGIGADVVVGPDHYAQMPELVGQAIRGRTEAIRGRTEAIRGRTEAIRITGADEVPSFLMASPDTMSERGAVSCFVPIQKGCDNWCAFCVVPAARGREITRPLPEILEECCRFLAAGARELFLLGQNVNSVRLPGGFPGLLEAVAALPGVLRVRFTTSHPRDCSPQLANAMSRLPQVMPWLHLPVQSGSSRILAAMGRGYTRDHYFSLIDLFRREVPGIAFTTDVIVGFPGETDADFEATLAVAAAAEYDSAYTFIYSPRPGTQAAERTEHFVDPAVVGERYERLRDVVQRSGLRKHEARIGRIEEVLVEGPSRQDPGVLTGRTAQNKLAHFPSPTPIATGSYALVEVTAAAAHHLHGELREVVHVAVHKTRIPVAAI